MTYFLSLATTDVGHGHDASEAWCNFTLIQFDSHLPHSHCFILGSLKILSTDFLSSSGACAALLRSPSKIHAENVLWSKQVLPPVPRYNQRQCDGGTPPERVSEDIRTNYTLKSACFIERLSSTDFFVLVVQFAVQLALLANMYCTHSRNVHSFSCCRGAFFLVVTEASYLNGHIATWAGPSFFRDLVLLRSEFI